MVLEIFHLRDHLYQMTVMMMMKKKMMKKISANIVVAKTFLEVAKQPVRLKRYNSHTRHVVVRVKDETELL